MATDWNAMQAAGAKSKKGASPGGGVTTKYMAGGSWRASLSSGGILRPKKK